MSKKRVLAHSCSGADIGACRCQRKVTEARAALHVDRGEADWLKRPDRKKDEPGHILLRKRVRPAPAQTITARQIERAFTDERAEYDRRRIELYPAVA